MRVFLKRTVVGDCNWRLGNVSESHHQSQGKVVCQSKCFKHCSLKLNGLFSTHGISSKTRGWFVAGQW